MRFFAVGEYGDKTERPHYHVALFNMPGCQYGFTRGEKCCENCELYRETWGHGNIFAGSLTWHSAQYVANYVTKKMTDKGDRRLNGRHPEFTRMSRNPGIGVDAMWDIASRLMEYGLDERLPDVPSGVQVGKKFMPYGRTLRKKLRVMVGKDEKAPPATVEAIKEELSALREIAFDSSQSFSSAIVEDSLGAVRNLEARALIFKKERKL